VVALSVSILLLLIMSSIFLTEMPFYSMLDFEIRDMYSHNKWDILENDSFFWNILLVLN